MNNINNYSNDIEKLLSSKYVIRGIYRHLTDEGFRIPWSEIEEKTMSFINNFNNINVKLENVLMNLASFIKIDELNTFNFENKVFRAGGINIIKYGYILLFRDKKDEIIRKLGNLKEILELYYDVYYSIEGRDISEVENIRGNLNNLIIKLKNIDITYLTIRNIENILKILDNIIKIIGFLIDNNIRDEDFYRNRIDQLELNAYKSLGLLPATRELYEKFLRGEE